MAYSLIPINEGMVSNKQITSNSRFVKQLWIKFLPIEGSKWLK